MKFGQANLRLHWLFAIAVTVVWTSDARAQEPSRIEVTTEYAWMRDPQSAEISLGWTSRPLSFEGWRVEGAWALARNVSIVGDVSGYYATHGFTYFYLTTNLRNYAFLGGPRFSFRAVPHTVLFGQVLLGWAHAAYGIADQPQAGDSVTDHAIQPVGGVQLWFLRRVGVQAEAGFRRILFNSSPRSTEQIAALGLVVSAF
jgi:hypothetical protein